MCCDAYGLRSRNIAKQTCRCRLAGMRSFLHSARWAARLPRTRTLSERREGALQPRVAGWHQKNHSFTLALSSASACRDIYQLLRHAASPSSLNVGPLSANISRQRIFRWRINSKNLRRCARGAVAARQTSGSSFSAAHQRVPLRYQNGA